LVGTSSLPQETRRYVFAITGTSAESWRQGAADDPDQTAAPADCKTMIALLKRTPSPFMAQLERHVRLVAAAPWGIQLSAGFSRERALASYAAAAARYAGILEGHDPSILSTILRSRGARPLYQVRAGADTRAEAEHLCGQIRKVNGACLVLRNADPGATERR
jgi:hypothetical protein